MAATGTAYWTIHPKMFPQLRQMFRPTRAPRRVARVPEGERYYLIGDIHGRLDLFNAIVGAVEADDAAAGPATTTVVLLGDLVDRGPDSAGVIARARDWAGQRKVRMLAGNHAEMFLESFTDLEMLRHFVKHGGRETILSYGVDRPAYNRMTLDELQAAMVDAVPQNDRDFLAGFEEIIFAGDYVFVHAGINPAHPIDDQKRSDLLWIRERFLRHDAPFSHVVVHGHTIFDDVDNGEHRIGVDTGAFRTGRLTALVLEGDSRRTLQSVANDTGAITVELASLA